MDEKVIKMTEDKKKLIHLLSGTMTEKKVNAQIDWLTKTIPEIKPMIGMEQYNPNHCYDVWTHTVHSVIESPDNLILRITMLFHDIGKPMCYTRDEKGIGHFYGHPKESAAIAVDILERLGFEDSKIKLIKELIFYHDAQIPSKSISVKRWLSKIGIEQFRFLIEVKKADIYAQSKIVQKEKLLQVFRLEHRLNEVIENSNRFGKKDLNIDGHDLIEIGIEKGRNIGLILNSLVTGVLNGTVKNKREQLLKEAQKINLENRKKEVQND